MRIDIKRPESYDVLIVTIEVTRLDLFKAEVNQKDFLEKLRDTQPQYKFLGYLAQMAERLANENSGSGEPQL